MKIHLLAKLKKGYWTSLQVLENDKEFEHLIWFIRGLLGIELKSLSKKTTTSELSRKSHSAGLKQQKDFPTYEEVKEFLYLTDELLYEDELEKATETDKHLVEQRRKKTLLFEKELKSEVQVIQSRYNLPLNWKPFIEEYLLTGQTFLEENEPIQITLKTELEKPENIDSYFDPYFVRKYDKNLEGIHIVINRTVSKTQLLEWVEANFEEIKQIMSKIKLPTLKESRVTALEKQQKYYNLVEKYIKDLPHLSEAITKASTEATQQEIDRLQKTGLSEDEAIEKAEQNKEYSEESIKEYHRRFKKHLDKLHKKQLP